jgi:hypothetical protein
MAGERAALLSTDPPYCVNYTGNDRPIHDGKSSGKDWTAVYREIDIADLGEFLDKTFVACLPHVDPERMTRTQKGRSDMVPKNEKNERNRRTPDGIVADLQHEIERVKARQAAREARQQPEVQALVAALRGIDRAARVAGEAGRDGLVRALEAARAPLSEQVVALGVRLPDRKAKRGRTRKGTEAA